MTSSDRILERVLQHGEPRCIIHTSINTGFCICDRAYFTISVLVLGADKDSAGLM